MSGNGVLEEISLEIDSATGEAIARHLFPQGEDTILRIEDSFPWCGREFLEPFAQELDNLEIVYNATTCFDLDIKGPPAKFDGMEINEDASDFCGEYVPALGRSEKKIYGRIIVANTTADEIKKILACIRANGNKSVRR